MQLAFDGRVLRHSARTGVEHYAQSIYGQLQRHFTLLKPISSQHYLQQVWEHTILPLRASKGDLLFCPANIAPLYLPANTRLVLTLHDVAFKRFSQSFSSMFRTYYSLLVPKNIDRADRIITISEASKREILSYYPQAASKLAVIPLGVDEIYRPVTGVEKQKQILFVGSINERKNIIGVLKAFAQIPKSLGYRLVIVGKRSDIFSVSEQLKILLAEADQNPNIVFKGQITQEELLKEYNTSACLLFPSFYEGFGLPPLEAMACGTPVITSNVSSMPEVCGDAALYCDPYSIDDITNKVELLLDDETLREALRQKGLERAKLFSWEKAAAAHFKVFDEVVNV